MVIVIVVKDDDPVQLRMDDIYDHSFVSTIQHHVHHISNSLATFNSPDTLLLLVGSLSLPNRASADACSSRLNYLKRVQLAFLIVPVRNHAASFDSSARISFLVRFPSSSRLKGVA